MDRIRVNSLQLAVAAFFAMIAALMLITPHTFRFLSSIPVERRLFLWGMLFLSAALGLCAIVIARLPRWMASLFNLAASGLLITLAVEFLHSSLWINSLDYAMLALGMAVAAYINARQPRRHSNISSDLLALMVGASSVLTGTAMLVTPRLHDFSAPQFFLLPGVFLLTGLLLAGVQVWKFFQTRPSRPLGRALTLAAPLVSAAFFLGLLALSVILNRNWTMVAYYSIFCVALAFMPLFSRSIDRLISSSLRTRLAFVLSAAMAVPLILTVALTSDRQEDLVRAEALARQESQAVALAHGISDYVTLNRSALIALAGQPGLMRETPEQQRKQLESFIHAFPDVVYFSTYDIQGKLIASYNNESDAITYNPRSQTDGTVSDDILRDGYMQRPLFGFGVPTHDDKGSYSGTASFALSSLRVSDFLTDQASALEGEVYLVDQYGKVISHPNELLAASYADLSQSPVVRAMLSDPNPTGSLAYFSGSGQQLGGYARVPGLDWGVVVERPASLALMGVYTGREMAFVLLMIALVVTSVSGSLLASWLTRPLRAMTMAMNTLANGQSGPPLPRTSFIEIQRMGIAFGRMRAALNLQTQKREQTLVELQQAKEGLEARVAERTSALRMVNLELKAELQNRDRLEKALIEKNQRISDILDSISDGFIALDNDFRIVYTNRQATPDECAARRHCRQ